MANYGTPIDELQCEPLTVPSQVYNSTTPLVLRGLVADWPLVKQAQLSDQAAVSYLKQFYNGQPVNAFLAKSESNGRIFYNEQLSGFNFVQSSVYLDDALEQIIRVADQTQPDTYYVGSLAIDQHLPTLTNENDLDLAQRKARKGIWLGNRTTIAPHFDFPDNIACCVIGERRFTLFPPEQHNNLYVGPLDFTPAGQPISLVDIRQPDLVRHPRFEHAMQAALTATLEPGDGIFIPSMWWHSVEGLSPLNGLLNYWWREMPDYMGLPNDALLHAILSVRALPEHQRRAWQSMFDHYVFEQPEDRFDHLPEQLKQQQNCMTEAVARKLRNQLSNKLR